MDKKSILIGVCFLFASLWCILALFSDGYKSYYISGIIMFAFVGVLFIKKANARK